MFQSCSRFSPDLRRTGIQLCARYATVSRLNVSPDNKAPETSWTFDQEIIARLSLDNSDTLTRLFDQYNDNAGHVLPSTLPYESRPSLSRQPLRQPVPEPSICLIAHAFEDTDGKAQSVTISSGFALEAKHSGKADDLFVTCAHTLEQIQRRYRAAELVGDSRRSGTFVISGSADGHHFHPASAIPTSLPRSDLILLGCQRERLRTWPVSPYPAQPGAKIRAHFVSHHKPQETGWRPWIGGTYSKWVSGTVLGYRDFAGRETQPGTYDALSHLLFTPLPTPGSSGGPIVDEESGAVIGVMLGTRMDNRVEGVRGWGVPSESIFEMFSLPGLEDKR